MLYIMTDQLNLLLSLCTTVYAQNIRYPSNEVSPELDAIQIGNKVTFSDAFSRD